MTTCKGRLKVVTIKQLTKKDKEGKQSVIEKNIPVRGTNPYKVRKQHFHQNLKVIPRSKRTKDNCNECGVII